MDDIDRVDLGSGGLPTTFGTPLSDHGFSTNADIAALVSVVVERNAVVSNLSYADKLRLTSSLLSRPVYHHQQRLSVFLVSEDTSTIGIRDRFASAHSLEVIPYTPSSYKNFNVAWFKQLGHGLVVISPSVLLMALSQGLVYMANFACLIIDDVYSMALDDISAPVMTIIHEYYGLLTEVERPRLLGLTKHPLNVDANFGYAALRMEEFLDARVVGELSTRRAALKNTLNRVSISVLGYPVLQPQSTPTIPPAGQYHIAARATLHEIGACCYPLLAYFSVDSVLEAISPNNMFSALPAPNLLSGTSLKLDKFLNFIQAASEIPSYRCIIIGSNPFTVLALGWILSAHQRPGIRSSVYLGQVGQEVITGSQYKTLEMFQNGSLNTLVCTDAILSDIDGGVCSHVVWFNPHSSLIAFAHSRLLAHYSGASLVIMAEHDNREHYRAIRDVLHAEPMVSNWIYNMDVDGAPIPPSSLARCPRFGGTPIILTPSRPRNQGNHYILDPVSGSRIYPKDATEVLYRYLASQLIDENTPPRVLTYTSLIRSRELWFCTVDLSAFTPSLKISGNLCPSKAAARTSACMETCLKLFELRLLPCHAFPLRPVHTLTFGVLQHGSSLDIYPVASPIFWHNCLLAAPSHTFYPVVVNFLDSNMTSVYRSTIILTRLPLPVLDSFLIFSSRKESEVQFQPCQALALSAQQTELVFRYTMYIWRALTNKPYECPSGELAYLVCPAILGNDLRPLGLIDLPSVEPLISWQEMEAPLSERIRPLNLAGMDGSISGLAQGVIQDRANEFTRRFEGGHLRRDLNPLSKIMKEQEHSPMISLLDYYSTHRHEFEGIKDLRQPLIEARLLPGLANRLDPGEPATEITNHFLVPEMCYISNISAATFQTSLIIPSIVWHIENALVAKELNLTLFQGQIRDDLLMNALCSQMAKRTFNYERLEFLGDTFIKYAASVYLYGTLPDAASGPLHSRRQMMVCNKSLWTGAQAIGLPPCIQSEPFRPKQWTIPNVGIATRDHIQDTQPDNSSGSTKPRVQSRTIAVKTVADVVEAIIGAALLSGGEKLAFSVAKTLGFDVPVTCDWLEVVSYAPSKIPKHQEPHSKEILRGMMKIIGTTLEDPDLLLQAMHHPSLSIHSESYERLEFLGDSVLDMLVVQSFFSDEEKWSPHGMTVIKSSMVSNRVLAIICVESGLHRFLLHDKPSLTQNIKSFVEEVEKGKREAETASERTKHWSSLRAPKVELGDMVEAVLGAIFVSSGFKISRVKAVYERLLKPFYDRYIDKKAMLAHPMTRLLSRLEAAGCTGLGVSKIPVPSKSGKGLATKCEVKIHDYVLANSIAEKASRAIALATEEAKLCLDLKFNQIMKCCTCKGKNGTQGKKRKRVLTEDGEIAEVDESIGHELVGSTAENPIDVDMFDF